MVDTLNQKSIYEQVGGESFVEKAVGLFYEKVLADDILMEFFIDVNLEVLKEH